MNSTRTRDSAILVDSGDGSSAGALGPPYAIAGTFFFGEGGERDRKGRVN